MVQTAVEALTVHLRDVVVPILTALLGYLLSQLQTMGNISRERSKALNGVLYTLLEMRWEVKASNPSIALGTLRRVLVKRFGDEAQKVLELPEVEGFFHQLIEHALPSGRESLKKRYVEAVQAIVPYYPTVAYKLANPDIVQLDTKLKNYLEEARQHPAIVLNPKAPASIAIIEDNLLTKAFEQALGKLTEDLKRIVALYPVFSRIQIARVVKDQDRRSSPGELDQFMDQALEDIMTGLPV